MKRLLTAIIGLTVSMVLSSYFVFAVEPPADAYEITLYAGQTTEVGNVKVWNDAEKLYAVVNVDEPWCMTELHIDIANDMGGIPQTKAKKNVEGGNPIPGQFEINETYEECVQTSETFEWDLGDWGVSDTPAIAVHAVVKKCETDAFTYSPVLTWKRSSESGVAVKPGYGAQWTKEQGFDIELDDEAVVWDGGTGDQYFIGYSTRNDIAWASYVCTQNPSGKSTTGTDLRRFQASFDIPSGYNITGATLGSVNPGYEDVIPMNDNVYVFMNEELVFWGGTISLASLDPTRTHFLDVERRPTEPQNKAAFPETDGWHMNGTFPTISSALLHEGQNYLDVFAEELWTGGGMHKLGLTLDVEQTTCETESAWAGGEDFPGRNWATYFTYTLTEELLEPKTWAGKFYSDRHFPGMWSYSITVAKDGGYFDKWGDIILTDPDDKAVEGTIKDVEIDYPYWYNMPAVSKPNIAAVGTADYDGKNWNFMFLFADSHIQMILNDEGYETPWGNDTVWMTGRDYDIWSDDGNFGF